MGYIGNTLRIPCDTGGIFEHPNVDTVPPTAMIWPSRNLEITEGGRGKRGGTQHYYASGLTYQILGLYDFERLGGAHATIAATAQGYLIANNTNTIGVGFATTNFFSFETFENEVYICNGINTPLSWDGSGSPAWVTNPTDWTTYGNPQGMVKHGRGESERMWAWGCSGRPGRIFASASGDGKDFSNANVITIDIDTQDGSGIMACVEYGDRLFAFGKHKTWMIDDADVDTANWGYESAQWTGGVGNFRLAVKTDNDIVCMAPDGEIYSVSAVQSYGDYRAASITRKAFMNRWIQGRLSSNQIDQYHGIFDPVKRALMFFMVRIGETQVDTAIVHYLDRQPEEAWMIHDNMDSASGYSASCSALLHGSMVVTGGYSGYTWSLNHKSLINDNDNGYHAGFKTPPITCGDPRVNKNFKHLWVVSKPFGVFDLTMDWWIDGVKQTAKTITLTGTSLFGTAVFGTDVFGGVALDDQVSGIGVNGKRIQFEVYSSTKNQNFFMHELLLDWKPLGARPE